MAFPSNTGQAKAWLDMGGAAGSTKALAQGVRDASAAGSINYSTIENLFVRLIDTKERLVALASTPGLEAYARAQINNPSMDLAAEFNAMVTQIDATVTWIKDNLPKDGNGWLLVQQVNVSNQIVPRQFTTAQTAGLRTVLDALISAIG